MNPESENKTIMSPKFAATLFFALFSLLFLIFTKYTLLSLKSNFSLPLFPTLVIVVGAGALAGRLFAERLAKEKYWLRLMLIGFFLAIAAILLASLGILIHSYFYDTLFFKRLHSWQDYFIIYGVIVVSTTLIIGVWLIPLTGLAAIYFNKHFLPKLTAIDSMRRKAKDKV